jgi:hypothetical protein
MKNLRLVLETVSMELSNPIILNYLANSTAKFGKHLAHEYLHGIIESSLCHFKSLGLNANVENNLTPNNSHIDHVKNLLMTRDLYRGDLTRFSFLSADEIKKCRQEPNGWVRQFGILGPKRIEAQKSPYEAITEPIKYLVASLILLKKIDAKYLPSSCEFRCLKTILVQHLNGK